MRARDDEYELQQAMDIYNRRRRREPVPQSSAELLSRLMAQSGLAQTDWYEQLHREWEEAAGPEMAGKTRATQVRRGQLEVIVESSSAMQHLAFVKSKLLARMQQRVPDANIRSIRFRVGRLY